jgi:hypothetical protein
LIADGEVEAWPSDGAAFDPMYGPAPRCKSFVNLADAVLHHPSSQGVLPDAFPVEKQGAARD